MDISGMRCDLFFEDESSFSIGNGFGVREGIFLEVETVAGVTEGVMKTSVFLMLGDKSLPPLAGGRPARLYFRQSRLPEKMTAYYLFNDWWTRPAFIGSFEEIRPRTQVLLLKYADSFAALVPMVGRDFKASLAPGGADEICFELTGGLAGHRKLHEPLFLYAEGSSVDAAVHAVFCEIEKYYGLLPREERQMPEMFSYLGWCSWDAFYKKVSAEGMRAKAAEISEKEAPIRWMLIDDGWMDTEDRVLRSFSPDPEKFPGGFAPLIRDIQSDDRIRWFGVWHAMAGYWDGVAVDAEIAGREGDYLCRTGKGLFPHPEKGERFYSDWYDLLRGMGIRFVKVDGQSSSYSWYEGCYSGPEGTAGANAALESGVSRMKGAVINCMGMAMENIVSRPVSALSRNSDDFVPDREGGFAEHLLQNAYNAIYHNELYVLDWDMFWTSHPDAERHAMLRAASGGPVYISDRVGETDTAVLKRVACLDGWIPMPVRSARPTADCIFRDPTKEGVLLLTNAGWVKGARPNGYVAAFNLTDRAERFSFSTKDIPEMKTGEKFWVYDFFAGKAYLLSENASFEACLEGGGYSWYSVIPAEEGPACLGLTDKYTGPSTVEYRVRSGQVYTYILHESGPVGFLSEQEIISVTVNGWDMTADLCGDGALKRLPLPVQPGKCVISVTVSDFN